RSLVPSHNRAARMIRMPPFWPRRPHPTIPRPHPARAGPAARYRGRVTTDDVTRVEPPLLGDERPLLVAWLDYYRATPLHKCSGLTPEQLVLKSSPPSDMSLAGLVRHLTEMERAYAHRLAEPGLALLYCTDDTPDGDFEGATAEQAERDLEIYAEHCERSR